MIVFERQYAHASGIVSQAYSDAKSRGDYSGASLVGLPSPETYKRRAYMMLWASVAVSILSGILAAWREHWSCWVAAVFTTVVATAIFVLVQVRY
jgi:hypothetical protein